MTDWPSFSAAEPAFAGQVRAILTSTTNCVLGTLCADGSPRLSGIDPFFAEERLWIGSMPDARKGADLRRDPRLSIHAVPWESRRVADGRESPGDMDAKITGTAHLADDAERRRVFGLLGAERGFDAPDEGDLFEIHLSSAVAVSVADDQLVIERWTPTEGLKVIRRS